MTVKAHKTDGLWSPRKWKLYLLALWCAGTAFWVPIAYDRTEMGLAWDAYSTYSYYENKIQTQPPNVYTRQGYMKAEAYLEQVDPYIWSFLMTGVAAPLLLLMGGAWLLRNA